MSFGMYWMHRALHVNPWLWRNIHSIHHWAKHPLSRTTYQDHWFDNFGNAIVGHFFAQVLIPLDHDMFWFSRVLRICELLFQPRPLNAAMASFCSDASPPRLAP